MNCSAFGAAQINETNTQVNTNTGQIANKLNSNGDGQNVTVTYTSNDVSSDASATAWTVISKFTSGETLKSLFGKVSTLCKNVRYLYNNKRSKSESFNSTSDTISFTTEDVANDAAATSWTADVSQLTSGLTHANLMNRISAMMKNTRYLKNLANQKVNFKSIYLEWTGSNMPAQQTVELGAYCVPFHQPIVKHYIDANRQAWTLTSGDLLYNNVLEMTHTYYNLQVLIYGDQATFAFGCFMKLNANSGVTIPESRNRMYICIPYMTVA